MCCRPNLIYTNGVINEKTGKEIFHFKPYDKDLLEHCIKSNTKFFLVPCGQCYECKSHIRKTWTIRLLNELQSSNNAYFVTLTFDDLHYPKDLDECKSIISRFFKSLKQKYGKEIKYYCCFELGETTYRPHFHAIIYNLNLDDLTDYDDDYSQHYSKSGKKLLFSSKLKHLWSNGLVCLDIVNYATCSYVAGYVNKKLSCPVGNNGFKPFSVMSKGLGYKYLNENIDKLCETDEVFYTRDYKVFSGRLPRYYLKKLEKNNKILFDKVHNVRLSKIDNYFDYSKGYLDVRNKYNNKKFADFERSKKFSRGF